ncbi:hypothetical protein BH10BAC3_BH10BAC3_07220 [soil metagenome]
MKKETWIDDVLHSIDGQKMAEPNPFLHTRVLAKLQQQTSMNMPRKWMYAISAVIVLLCVANISLFTNKYPAKEQAGINQVMQEYGLNNNDMYSITLSNK